jgi:serine/threonine-protein kinase HipA
MEEKDTEEELRLLFAPGSSLGGARPKASVREKDGHLAIAKFPRKDDEINTVVWEAVALSLAQKSGIAVPNPASKPSPASLCSSCDASTATANGVFPFLSAMSMLGSKDNETRSYLEIVDALRQHGAAPKADMEALWRRLVFNILISNTDDHLRNHGFLYEGQAGWRLSPAYDLNPVPTDIKPRILSTAINEDDNTASLALAMEVAGYFELDDGKARDIAKQVGKAVSKWRDEAARHGLTKSEIDRMSSAFEHDDLKAALAAR